MIVFDASLGLANWAQPVLRVDGRNLSGHDLHLKLALVHGYCAGVLLVRGPVKKTASRRMPNKFNADHRHHIPKMLHFVRNWPEYESGLRNRGSLTFWVTPQAMQL